MSASLMTMAALLASILPGQITDGFAQPTIERAYDALAPAVCIVRYTSDVSNPNTGESSKRDASVLGLLVSADGLVMAAGHMEIENSQPFNIRVSIGKDEAERDYPAILLRKPEEVNICLLRIQPESPLTNLPHARFARGIDLSIGDPVLLIGLLGEPLDFARSIYTCRIGAILDKPRTTYCLDSTIRFGFVGSPVVDTEGRVVGVVGFDLTPSEGGDLYIRSGHPLIYQADLFAKYLDNPPGETEGEDESDGWMGIFTQPLTDDLAAYWGLPQGGGIVVATLVAGAPAELAGLERGDIITEFNGVPMRAKQDNEVRGFTKLVREAGVGSTVAVKFLRGGQAMERPVTLVSRPKSASEAFEFEDKTLGLTVREITTDLRLMANLPENVQGVIVRRVESGGTAALAGMQPGMIIMNLGDQPVPTVDEYKAAVERIINEKPREVTAFCRAGARTGFLRLNPRW